MPLVRFTLALAFCTGSLLFAQSPVDGALRGRILAPPGAPAVSVSVQIQRDDSSWRQTISSARDGSFTLLNLTPGDYTIAAGPCAAQPVSISPGEIAQATIDLAACAPAQPHVAQTTPLPLLTLDPLELSELDSAAHDATLAAAPADETTADEPATPEAARETTELGSAGPSVSGLSPTANSTLLDGLSTTQNFRSGPRGSAAGGPRTSATFNESATRSFQLQPHSFSAQYGGAGGVIAVTSRGQAERLHGSAFALTRESALAATNPFSVVTHYNDGAVTSQLLKPADSLVQFGAAAGLPLSRARVAWLQNASLYTSLEIQLRSGQIVSTPATANFYALTPEQLALLANRGVSTAAANTALNFLDSLTGAQQRDATRLLSFARLDLVPASNQQLTFGYIGNRFNSPTGSSSGASEARRCTRPRQPCQQHASRRRRHRPLALPPLAALSQRTPRPVRARPRIRNSARAAPAGARDQRRRLRPAGLHRAQRLQLRHAFQRRPHRVPRRAPPPTRRHLLARSRPPSVCHGRATGAASPI